MLASGLEIARLRKKLHDTETWLELSKATTARTEALRERLLPPIEVHLAGQRAGMKGTSDFLRNLAQDPELNGRGILSHIVLVLS